MKIRVHWPRKTLRNIIVGNNSALYALSLLCLLAFSPPTLAQVSLGEDVVVDYSKPREYEIGGVTVSGLEYLDKNVLIMLTGLNVGETVEIPGDEITKAIRKLWTQGLFEDISINVTEIQGNMVFLELYLKERPRMSNFSIKGVNKTEADNIREKINLSTTNVVTESLLMNTRHKIREYFREKGFMDATVEIIQHMDTVRANYVALEILIDKKSKVKISKIYPEGNSFFTDQKVKNALKETKERGVFSPLNDLEVPIVQSIGKLFRLDLQGIMDAFGAHFNKNIKLRIFKASKFIEDKYEEDLINLIAKYNAVGYRDAIIAGDSVYRNPDGTLSIKLKIDEGDQYFFRNITWIGNTVYSTEILDRVLKIQKGDVYNKDLLDRNLMFNATETDVSSLYMDRGYLFFQAEPVEVAIENDSIDLEIRLREGKQARINKVMVKGNTKTNDHVVMREIRTRPGQLFSRSDLMRTIRELAQLKYFNPESITPDVVPNVNDGTVDLTFNVEETSADQIELSGGWGYGRIIGTLGLSFNNFSLKNIFNWDAWKPVPSGDGQKLSLRFQSYGKGYLSYSFSFTEPWLGGKKPNAFSVTYWHSLYSNGLPKNDPARSTFKIDGVSFGLGKRLKWPDDFFTLYHAITLQWYELYQYSRIFSFSSGTGNYNNFAYNIILGRSSVSQPIYPRNGSDVSLSLEVTPPYSLFSDKNYDLMSDTEKYKWIEYHKWKINATFFTEIFEKGVIMTRAKFGFLGKYNNDIGVTPFERFYLGGDGLSGYNNLDGREIIGMRGYGNETITPVYWKDKNVGGTIYSKYTLEMRYPLSLNPSATIYGMAFLEAGNAWIGFRDFNPFEVYRAAGVGVRVFLPMFGILGLDWGYGFDEVPGIPNANGSQFHFSINQSID